MNQKADLNWSQVVRIERDSGLPVVRQLYRQLHQLIISGQLAYQVALPPSRQLAKALGVARGYVTTCYERLSLDGLVTAQGRRGTWVCYRAETFAPSSSLGSSLSSRGQRISQARDYQPVESWPFRPGAPDHRLFPLKSWQKVQRWAERARSREASWYQRGAGLPALKQALAGFLSTYRHMSIEPEQVLITCGTQSSLSLLAHVLANSGEWAWLERGAWAGARGAMQGAGLQQLTLELDEQGACLPAESRVPARLLYLTPTLQFPFGMSMSAPRRAAFLDYAKRHQGWILEDDYVWEYMFEHQPSPPLCTQTRDAPVIYLGTGSKILLPGLRIGWMVVPPALIEPLSQAVELMGLTPNYQQQAVLAEFIRLGYLSQHLQQTRHAYAQRRFALEKALVTELDHPYRLVESRGGMSTLIALNDPQFCNITVLENFKKIRLGCELFVEKYRYSTAQYLYLGHANVSEQLIPVMVQRLAKALSQAKKETP